MEFLLTNPVDLNFLPQMSLSADTFRSDSEHAEGLSPTADVPLCSHSSLDGDDISISWMLISWQGARKGKGATEEFTGKNTSKIKKNNMKSTHSGSSDQQQQHTEEWPTHRSGHVLCTVPPSATVRSAGRPQTASGLRERYAELTFLPQSPLRYPLYCVNKSFFFNWTHCVRVWIVWIQSFPVSNTALWSRFITEKKILYCIEG